MNLPNESAAADDSAQQAAPAASDEIKNIKAEMGRKLGNLEATNSQLASQLEQLMRSMQPPAKAEPTKKVSVFEDEDAYAERIKSEVIGTINKQTAATSAYNNKVASVLQSATADFPELSNQGHELTKLANEKYAALSPEDKANPISLKAAINEAALELGVKPMKKRSSDDADTFSVGGNRSSAPAKKRDSDVLDDKTKLLAEAFGIDLKDDKVRERVIKRHSRKNYTSWE
jgi:hypothetical protein